MTDPLRKRVRQNLNCILKPFFSKNIISYNTFKIVMFVIDSE